MEGLEIAKALEEAQKLVGARLSKVHQIGDVFLLRFFAPPGALALDPQGKAFHRTELRPPGPPRPPTFCQLLRTLEGQPLLSLDQAGFDRVVRLRFPEVDLILDLRPRLGNLFFLGRDGRREALRDGVLQEAPFGLGEPEEGLGPELRRALSARLGRPPDPARLKELARELLSLPPKGFLYETPHGLRASFFLRSDLNQPVAEFPTFWEALDRVLETRIYADLAKTRREELAREIARKRKALAALAAAEKEAQSGPELKEKADLILTRLAEIPKGVAKVIVESFEGKPVEIELDPSVPPQQYAQALYKRAQKFQRTLAEIPRRRAAIEGEIARLGEEIEVLQKRPELAPYLMAWEEAEPQAKGALAQPRQFRVGEFTVLVGRSAKENEEILRRASPNDLWLHARGVPGAHVLIKNGGRTVPEEVLLRAAKLAAWHSKARGERKVEVSYTEVRYLRKPKGSPPGTVSLLRERVIVVPGEESL